MLCSNCGHKNPALNRFCGMCGTPLPQKPITAPEAPSTPSLTQPPIESPPSAPPPSSRVETNAVENASPASDEPRPSPAASMPVPTPAATVPVVAPSAEANYFAQAQEAESLEQFIAGFHYTPPSEGDEVTMRGDKPVVDAGAKLMPAAPVGLSDEPAGTADPPTAVQQPQPREEPAFVETPAPAEPPPFAVKNGGTQTPDRSRFLDVGEPPAAETPKSDIPPVVEPAFLDLGDSPVPREDVEAVTPRRSHRGTWAAAIVILILAGLGGLEWQARRQDRNGPIAVLKMEIERLKQRVAAKQAPSEQVAAPGSQPSQQSAGPEIAPAQQPQTTAPAEGSKPDAPPEKAADPKAVPTAPPPAPQPKVESKVPAQNDASDKPAPAPGAEELAKAANASDAAAASAWLWKAVAKGNPDAPIRLANLYIRGNGVPQSCEQAVILLQSAAAKRNAAADSRLGAMYATGTCVPRDRVRAYGYMSSAVEANPNAAWARDFRAQLWTHMTPEERSQAQKFR